MVIIFVLCLCLLGCVRPDILAAAAGIILACGLVLIIVSAAGISIEWQEVTRLVPVITVK